MRNRVWLVIVATVFMAACGAVAAPPVDLPAPTIGRIGADGVGDTGKATIIGEPGTVEQEAIDEGVLILGINERLADAQTLLWDMTDFIASQAYAQSAPAICERVGFFCAEVVADGSFILHVDAIVGDKIFIVLIDREGKERSPRDEFHIPTSANIKSCVDTEATGRIVDLKNVLGYPIALYQGQGEIPNRIVIGETSFEIPGCFAKDLAVHIGPTGLYIAVVSPDDKVAWMGRWADSQLVVAKTFIRDDAPVAIAFDGDPTYMLLAETGSAGMAVRRVSLLEKTTVATLTLPDLGYAFDDAFGLQTAGPFADAGYLGSIMVSGYDGSQTQYSFVFFYTATMSNATVGDIFTVVDDIVGPHSNPYVIADVQFGEDTQVADLPLVYVLTDRGNTALYVMHLETATFSQIQLVQTNAADLVGNVQPTIPAVEYIPSQPFTPGRMALGVTLDRPIAYVLSDEGKLWRIANYPGTGVLVEGQVDLAGAVAPVLIDVNDTAESVLVGDGSTDGILDFSQFWGAGT